jgi:hypothetical protein
MPLLGSVGSVHPVAVQLTRSAAGDIAVPDEIGPLAEEQLLSRLAGVRFIEETQLKRRSRSR